MALSKTTAWLVIISFGFILAFSLSMTMKTDDRGHMDNCPFSAFGESMCQMDIFEHLASFQKSFTGVPGEALLFTIILVVLAFGELLKTPPQAANYVLYRRNRRQHPVSNNFLIALSDGIIQPKLYS